MATILAIDTSMNVCSVALVRNGAALAVESVPLVRGHSERLMPMISALFEVAAAGPSDLDGVAVTRGPGAFTGVRIGLSAARAFALACDIPCIGVSGFDVLAASARTASGWRDGLPLLIAIETKRADVYLRIERGDGAVILGPVADAPNVVRSAIPDATCCLAVGDAVAKIAEAIPDLKFVDLGIEAPDPVVIATLAAQGLTDPAAHPPDPIYLRPPDVTMPAPR